MNRLLKAIIVEDDPTLCRSFAEILNNDSGIEAAQSHSLVEATRLCRLERQVVLVVDLGLPDARGVDAVTALRKEIPGATLVIISGSDELRGPSLAAGAHAFILKASPESSGPAFIAAVRAAVVAHSNQQLFAPAFHGLDRIVGKIDQVDTKIGESKSTLKAL